VPAAAVIPAPIAYIKVAAVKKLVVGFLVRCPWVVACYLFLYGRDSSDVFQGFFSADHLFWKEVCFGFPSLYWERGIEAHLI